MLNLCYETNQGNEKTIKVEVVGDRLGRTADRKLIRWNNHHVFSCGVKVRRIGFFLETSEEA